MMLRRFGVLVLLFSPLYSFAQTANLQLGFTECHPAILVKPQAGLAIRISGITRDSFGYVEHFTQEIQYPDSKPIVLAVKVDNTTWKHDCAGVRYEAEIDGKRVASPTKEEFGGKNAEGFLGFDTQETGGVLLPSGKIKITTGFSYDEHGQRNVARQEFMFEEKMYVVAYSGHERDKFGRLSGYKLLFEK